MEELKVCLQEWCIRAMNINDSARLRLYLTGSSSNLISALRTRHWQAPECMVGQVSMPVTQEVCHAFIPYESHRLCQHNWLSITHLRIGLSSASFSISVAWRSCWRPHQDVVGTASAGGSKVHGMGEGHGGSLLAVARFSVSTRHRQPFLASGS